jgi:hypothetical protein
MPTSNLKDFDLHHRIQKASDAALASINHGSLHHSGIVGVAATASLNKSKLHQVNQNNEENPVMSSQKELSLRVYDWLPPEANEDFENLRSLSNSLVIAEFTTRGSGNFKPWPGKHKNVTNWIAIEGGKAIGWNENPSKGWSFPVISYQHATGAVSGNETPK